MKTNLFKISALLFAGIFTTQIVQGQTALSGTGANTCTANGNGSNTNTSVGCSAGSTTMSTNNTCIGNTAGTALNSSGQRNTFDGTNAGASATSGSYNVYSGYAAGNNNTTGSLNVVIGDVAGSPATTATYSFCAMVGQEAGHLTTSGGKNCFMGYTAGYNNTTGTDHVIIGYNAGGTHTTATGNTIIGSDAGAANTASSNTFIGRSSGNANTSGSEQVFIGFDSGKLNTTGSDNVIIGFQSGNGITTSGHNTILGSISGQVLTTTGGQSNTLIGYNTNFNAATYSNCTALGNTAGANWLQNNGSNTIEFGNTSISKIYAQVTTITASDRRIKNNIKENVPGLDFINLLKPVTYHFDIHKENNIVGYPKRVVEVSPAINDSVNGIFTPAVTKEVIDTSMWDGKYDIEKITYSGLIAQQVDSAAKKIGYDFSGIAKAKGANGLYGLSYSEFVVPLIKAVQELSHTVDSLKSAKSAQRTMQNEPYGKAAVISNIELANNAMLYQNSPNPFGEGTTIKYFVPDNSNAQVAFFDEFGNKLKEFKIEEKGMGQLNVATVNLSSGFYSYSLLINGKIVDTKKMIKNQ